MLTREQFEAKSATAKAAAFDRFMQQPTIRVLISMIPRAEHEEVLTTLLQEAFTQGWSCGTGDTLITVLEHALKLKPEIK